MENRWAVAREQGIGGKEVGAMLDRLGDEKTIEGVAMVPGEIRNSSGGSRHNRQLPKASLAGSRQKDVRREVEIRTPEAELDRDLEDVHRAE